MKYTYQSGRFFISPHIGCEGKCLYCYLNFRDVNKFELRYNQFSIDQILKEISQDENFIKGKEGSIISLGGYCDLFPLESEMFTKNSVEWIQTCLASGNPVQIMSKNILIENYIDEIVSGVTYDNQLLYSTTVTTFRYSEIVEGNTSAPINRLKTLQAFNHKGIPTNVMIKPFLPNITDLEINEFIRAFKCYQVNYCVVGEILVEDIDSIKKVYDKLEINFIEAKAQNSILDCSDDKECLSITSKLLDDVIEKFRLNGIQAFKKSSCVNANLLKIKNPSDFYNSNSIYCINCGNCA